MPFYRKKITYDELAPFVQKFRDFLRQNCSLVKEADDYAQEVFFVDKSQSDYIRSTFEKSWNALACAGFLEATPFDYNHTRKPTDQFKPLRRPTCGFLSCPTS